MDLLLINLPTMDFTQPPLAIPSIIGYIKEKSNYNIKEFDLNIEFFDRIFSYSILNECINRIKVIEKDSNKIKIYNSLPRNIEASKEILRSNTDFYDFAKYTFAINNFKLSVSILNKVLDGMIIDDNFNISFNGIDFLKSKEDLDRCIEIFESNNNKFFYKIIKDIIVDIIKKECPKVIGLSNIYDSQTFFNIYISKLIKEIDENIIIFSGGSSITELIYNIKEDKHIEIRENYFKSFDYFIVYEGEVAVLNLLNFIYKKDIIISNIKNIVYYDSISNKYIFNKTEYICDLNELPTPVFDDKFLKKYFVPEVVLPIAPTRGCYWGRCKFCSYGLNMDGTATAKYREMNSKTLISHLFKLKNRHKAKYFSFTCDAIGLNSAELYAKEIIEANLNIKWMSDFRLEKKFIDKKFCETLMNSGLKYISFGMESYSQKILNDINKGLNNSHFENAIKNLYNNNISVDLMLFKNFPTEKETDYLETLDFINKVDKYICITPSIGKFTLLTNSYVGKHVNEYNIDILDIHNKKELFYDDTIPYKWKGQYKISYKTIEKEDELYDYILLGQRPWVGGNQNAHSILFIDKYGKEGIRLYNEYLNYITFIALNLI